MPRVYKPDPRGKRIKSHDRNEIENAIKDIKENNLSYRSAAKKYNISYSVLYRHATRMSIKKPGGQTALSELVEQYIIENLNICAEWGYPLDEYDLRLIVKMYLDKKGINSTKFKNNFPGKDFALGFLKRHKAEISVRYAQNIKRARAAVNSATVKSYFENLEVSLEDVPPKNIVNYDETNLSDDPGKKKIIAKRGMKYPERVMNNSKSSTSIMMAGNAEGYLLPPYVIYKSLHLYDSWTNGGPKGTQHRMCTEKSKIKQENALKLADKGSAESKILTEQIIGNEIQLTDNQSEEPECMIKALEPLPGCSKQFKEREFKCHMCSKPKNKGNWITCIACKNKVCPDCIDGDVLAFEFICLKCFDPDESDDSVRDRDYLPSSSDEE